MSDELYHARGVHMFHCGPFNDGVCKYGDADCPACVADTKPSDVDGLIAEFTQSGGSADSRGYIEIPRSKTREAATTLAAQQAREQRLERALETVMIGGNHLALLIGVDHPPFTAAPDVALAHYGAGDTYEIWCAWQSVMLARAALKEPS